MSTQHTAPRGGPIRVDDLRPKDHVILFGAVVEIRDTVRHPEFPGALHVTVRRRFDTGPGAPVATLLPKDLLLAGVWVPRDVNLHCVLCQQPTPMRQHNIAGGGTTTGPVRLVRQP